MGDGITRRDFLNGVALAIGANLAPLDLARGESAYPPSSSGMRGSTDASAGAAHALRDGRRFAIDTLPIDETVDLAIVGAGISGLAAAHYYRQRHRDARILLLDSHDDFGGHACRCEMNIDGRRIISYGGSESIQSPAGIWSESSLALLRELGIDLGRFETAFDRDLYPSLGLSRGILFKREDFGVDRLVGGDPTRMVADDIRPQQLNARSPAAFIGDFPLDAQARAGLTALYVEERDALPGKSVAEKQALLAATSYRDFLIRYWGLSEAAANTFQKRSHDFFAIGIDGLPAIAAAATGYPGFRGLALPSDPQAEAEMNEPYIHHFPDGNASVARLLVRELLPAAAPGSTMDDIVTAPFDYSKLDVSGGKIRIRLNSTVVTLSNVAGGKVDVGYVRDGALRRVQARSAIHAGYSAMLPYMLDGMKEAQREALSASVRAPIVYVKVGVRNWTPWVKAGVHEVTNPMGFCSRIKLDYPVSLGSVPLRQVTRRTDVHSHGARARTRSHRSGSARRISRRAQDAAINDVRAVRGQCEGRAHSNARAARLRCAPRYHCDQCVSLGARLCVGWQQSLRQGARSGTEHRCS